MDSSLKNTLFYAQHKNKCYCQNGNLCYCTGIENPSRNSSRLSSHKFIKVRSDKDKAKQNKPTTSLYSTSSSFSPTPTQTTSILASSRAAGVNGCDPKLTGRRELYERSKLEEDFKHKFGIRTWNLQEHIIFPSPPDHDLFNDEQISKLQEFRLQNADECLSSCKRFSIVDKMERLGKFKEKVGETKYTLNNRGLLTKIGGNDDSAPVKVASQSAAKDILRQKLSSSKDKDKLIRKALRS